MLPAPMVIVLGPLSARDSRRNDSGTAAARPPMPWFVLGVVALVGANSLVAIPAEFDIRIAAATTFPAVGSPCGDGHRDRHSKMTAKGFRPALLGAPACLFNTGSSPTLIKLMG